MDGQGDLNKERLYSINSDPTEIFKQKDEDVRIWKR